jgi:amino acid transporter
MSEEVKDAALIVPRAMVTSFVVNGTMGLIMLVSFLFCIPSVSDALADPTYYPFLYVLRTSMSNGAVNGITVIVLILCLAAVTDGMASASRQAFAFARDDGMPFSRWIAHVHPKLHVPVNAIIFTFGVTVILSLINIGSTTAFSAIISLQLSSLLFTYIISIACVFYRRLTSPELLPKARWSLGRFGPLVNGVSLVYCIYAFFWCFWPIVTPIDKTTFNWSSLMFTSLLIISGITYLVEGRRKYKGPVALVKTDRMYGIS